MRKNSNSILGHIMNLLGIQTSAMAQALHVDASLVSKWKSGARHLNKNSAYFDDVIDYILESGGDDRYEALRSALNDIFPQGLSDDTNDDPDTEQLLRRALADGAAVQTVSDNRLTSGLTTIPTAVFDGNAGRRDAVKRLLEYACSMEEPGELTFIDSDEFRWMTDDREYSLYLKILCLVCSTEAFTLFL